MSEFCSLCQVVEVGPYCPEHGLLHRPFSIGGRYDVEELIGARVVSFAFAAHDRTTGRAMAVNVLRPRSTGSQVTGVREAQQRFLRGATVLGKLIHEHIVGIVDFGWDDALGAPYLVTDRLSGQTAEAMVRRDGPLRWQQAVPLLGQICRALVAAHGRGITDGGLTAEQVFVVRGPGRQVVKLCDFGFTSLTGTPEQSGAPDPRDDIYGIATIAHELLTGRPPPEGSRASGSLSGDPVGVNQRFPALALPDKLDALIRACRSRDPMLRPSLAEIQATLQSLGAAPGGWAAAETQVTAAHAAVETDPLAVPAMIGSYRVVGELGTGGTGRVYLGQHPVIGSKVAIKVLLPEIARSPETVQRFIQEARASSQIGSPHIPRYFDFGTTPAGLPYAMMEYFAGETLGERLARVGTMSIAETAQILTQVATALMMAHEAGLIHRDLKPDNILLVKPDGKAARSTPRAVAAIGSGPVVPAIEVKVLDFGIAKMVGDPSATKTQSGYFLGTPFYCAPEQVFGHTVDARTDVYSLGATAFEMLSGAPPFVGQVPQILSSKATEDPPDLRDAGVPDAVAHTIGRMLAREPDHRAPSMAWVLEEVAGWARSGGLGAGSPAQVAAPAGRVDEAPEASRTFARADTALPASDDEPATTSQAIRVLALPHGRARRRTALLITGGVLVVAAFAVLIGVSVSRRATPAPSRPHDVPGPAAGNATTRAVPPPPATPVDPEARAHDASPPAPAGGEAARPPAPAGDPPGPVEGAASDPGSAPSSSRPSGRSPDGGRADKPADGHAVNAGGVPHRPRAKPPQDRKPPAKKPAPGDPKDVLIVDPFSHGN